MRIRAWESPKSDLLGAWPGDPHGWSVARGQKSREGGEAQASLPLPWTQVGGGCGTCFSFSRVPGDRKIRGVSDRGKIGMKV